MLKSCDSCDLISEPVIQITDYSSSWILMSSSEQTEQLAPPHRLQFDSTSLELVCFVQSVAPLFCGRFFFFFPERRGLLLFRSSCSACAQLPPLSTWRSAAYTSQNAQLFFFFLRFLLQTMTFNIKVILSWLKWCTLSLLHYFPTCICNSEMWVCTQCKQHSVESANIEGWVTRQQNM